MKWKDRKPLYDTPHAKAVSECGGVLIYGPQFCSAVIDPPPAGVWHVVVSTGIVHGVYGSSLKDDAEQQAKRIPFAYVTEHTGTRPRVGDQVWSME